jgi:Matrixin
LSFLAGRGYNIVSPQFIDKGDVDLRGKNFTRMGALIILQLFMLSSAAWAAMIIPAAPPAQENSQAPSKSAAFSENWDLERVDFIHYAKPIGDPAAKKTDPGYKLMGVKWLTTEGYAINNANVDSEGLDITTVKSIMESSSAEWDKNTQAYLFGAAGTTTLNYGFYDETNTIAFGPYSGSSNIIAVTSVWYTRTTKAIVEFDMLFNTYYSWGDADISGSKVMDLQNIATHEFGHAVGLADVYSTSNSEVTMYGYAEEGQTNKRTLEKPDLAGLHKIYGQ